MIVQRDGETFKVDVQKEIEVILYFPKLEGVKKDLINSNTILKEVDDTHITLELKDARKDLNFQLEGSMTDKGKELIDQAREVNLQKLGKVDASKADVKQQLEDCLSNYNSTRHKSKDGQTHNTNLPLKIDLGKDWYKGVIGDSDFREDRLSEAQVKQFDKDFVKIECEGLPEKVKEASLKFGSHPKSVEDLLLNFSSAGKKETEGKTDYSEINLGILDLMAERFNANKVKYEKGNTKKALDKQQILWALFRHVKKMVQPIEGDEENFKDHLAAVLTNCSILLDQLEIKK